MAEKKQNLVSVDEEYLNDLKGRVQEHEYYSAYYRGRTEGMEYVLDALREILKRKETRQ